MGTQIPPTDPSQLDLLTNEIPSDPSSENQPATPPTPAPQVPPTDTRYVSALEQVLRDQQRQMQRQADMLEELRIQRNAPPPDTRTREERAAEFYNDPEAVLNRRDAKLKADLEATIAPLLDVARELRVGNAYDKLKSRYKTDPTFAQHLSDPAIENAVDTIMRDPNVTTNEQTMETAILHVVGLKSIGRLPGAQTQQAVNVPNNTPIPPVIPPHSRPTPPAPPRNVPQNKSQVTTLTENELFLARSRGMTPEQYVEWINTPAEAVVTSQIGRTPPNTPNGGPR